MTALIQPGQTVLTGRLPFGFVMLVSFLFTDVMQQRVDERLKF